jgi:hypothetical protein
MSRVSPINIPVTEPVRPGGPGRSPTGPRRIGGPGRSPTGPRATTAPASSPTPRPRPPTGPVTTPTPPLGAVGGIPTPGNLLSAVSGLTSSFGALSGALQGGLGGLLSPNIELMLSTFDQVRSLETLDLSVLNVSALGSTSNQRRGNSSTGTSSATTPASDFASGDDSKVPNPLRVFNHYNYIITLGILSKEEANNPLSYRENGFRKIILQSGGGGLNKRHQVYAEQGDHAEYFIDSFNIDAIIGANPNTGVNLGTTLEFEVIEPYSMGKFTESLVTAASELGFPNFSNAPFCFRIDFQGWNDQGTNVSSIVQPYYIPVHFINVEFSVSNSGSRYQGKAVTINDVALSNVFNRTLHEVDVSGAIVHEILENSVNSLTNSLNGNSNNSENQNQQFITGFDKYIVVFPTTEDGILRAMDNRATPERSTVSEELGKTLGKLNESRTATIPVDPSNAAGTEQDIENRRFVSESSVYNTIKAYATTQINEIGRSVVTETPVEGSDQPFISPISMLSPSELLNRSITEAQVSEFSRNFVFSQGTTITSIIEEVIKESEYLQNNTGEEGENEDYGTRNWFRIDTYTFIDDDDPQREQTFGRKPRVYVYAVFLYEIDQAIHAASGTSVPGTEALMNLAKKEYNYIYTGKNEDVLNFDINFNYAFLQAAFSDYGNFSGAPDAASNATADVSNPQMEADNNENSETNQEKESPVGIAPTTRVASPNGGGVSNTNTRKRVAELFHNRLINSNVDMLSVEMTIWGDPYYLPSINGNYIPERRGRMSMINEEGRIHYLSNDVFIVVNFLTPLDYRQNGALMDFVELEERFSGLYRVLTVRNSFSNGEFKQELKLIRRHGQTDAPSGGPVLRTSRSGDRFDPYSSKSKNTTGAGAQRVSGVPTVLPQYGRGSAGGAIGQLDGLLGQAQGAFGQIGGVLGQAQGAIGQIGGLLGQAQGAIGQLQQIVQSPQQIFQAFSSIMPPQVLNFQSQFGQIQQQLGPVRAQIEATARSAAATQQRAGGAFAGQTPSALAPRTSLIPPQRPINTPSPPSVGSRSRGGLQSSQQRRINRDPRQVGAQ